MQEITGGLLFNDHLTLNGSFAADKREVIYPGGQGMGRQVEILNIFARKYGLVLTNGGNFPAEDIHNLQGYMG